MSKHTPNDERERIARELVRELLARLPAPAADSEEVGEAQLLELARQMVSLAQTAPFRERNDLGGATELRSDKISSCQRAEGVWNILALAHGADGGGQSLSGARAVAEVAAQHAARELSIHGSGAIKTLIESGDHIPTKTLAMMAEPLRALFKATLDKAASEALTLAYVELNARPGETRWHAEARLIAGEQEASERNEDDEDEAATLLLIAHTHTPFGEIVGSYWVGNRSVAGALFKRVSGIEAGETDDSMDRIGCTIIPAVDTLTLMSDVESHSLCAPDREIKGDEPWGRFRDEPLPLHADKEASAEQPAHEEGPAPQIERDVTASADEEATEQPAQTNSDSP